MNPFVYFALACVLNGGECIDDKVVVEQVVVEQVEGEYLVSGYDQRVDLGVAFTSQAPEKDWREPWQNACEETSVLMVDYFYNDIRRVDVETAKEDILHIFNVKEYLFEESLDESASLIVELINEMSLKWQARLVKNPSIDNVITEISQGRPVIMPLYARELNNTYYIGNGPDYHMLVIVGYDLDSREFIVNDPGTQFGEGLKFDFDVMMDALHDLNVEEYDQGEKVILFTSLR